MNYKYNIFDPYDWNINSNYTALGMSVRELAHFHLVGMAKQFLVTGQYQRTATWLEDESLPHFNPNIASSVWEDGVPPDGIDWNEVC